MISRVDGRRKELLAGIFLLVMTLINGASVFPLLPYLRNGYQDFTAFYTGGEMVRRGQNRQLYDLAAQYEVQKEFAPNVAFRRAALPYNHPPFEALLFVPLTFLNYLPAYLLWTCLNVIMLALSLEIVRRAFPEVGRLSPWFAILAATAGMPVVRELIQGQDAMLLLLVLTVSLASLQKNRDVIAGAALAAGLFKFHIVVPLTLVLAVRRPRLLLGFFPITVALVAISAMTVGWNGVLDYPQFLLGLERSGGGGAISATGMPNLRGLVAEVLGRGDSKSVMLPTIIVSTAVLGLALWRARRRDRSIRFVFAIASVTAILVSYHAIIHDLTLVLPVVLLLFAAPVPSPSATHLDTSLLMVVYTIFLSSVPWPWLSPLWCLPVLVWIFWKRLNRTEFWIE